MSAINYETARSMVADRDSVLAGKEVYIAKLAKEIEDLKSRVEAMTPLGDDESVMRASLSDYDATIALMSGRLRKSLEPLGLYDVVRSSVDELAKTKDERDRYKSAFDSIQRAADNCKHIAKGMF